MGCSISRFCAVSGAAMLIDWMSLSLRRDACPWWSGWDSLSDWGDRIQRITPATGQVVWESAVWDRVRSDTHQVMVSCSAAGIRVGGSPARVLGDGDTVFGSGDAGRSPFDCASAMIAFVSRQLGFIGLPSVGHWHCTRIDVTKNFDMGSLANVRVALSELREIEGGRYRVSAKAGDTVYWSNNSSLRSGKAYAKGPQLAYLMRQSDYSGRQYSPSEIDSAGRLLRLELRLAAKWFKRNPLHWSELSWSDLSESHDSYFGRMVGDIEVSDMSYIDAISKVKMDDGTLITASQARRVSATWAMIQSIGWQAAKETMPVRTWYWHIGILRKAGFGDADISSGRVVSIRRKLVMHPVSSWSELRAAS